jgi:hypothetical protein
MAVHPFEHPQKNNSNGHMLVSDGKKAARLNLSMNKIDYINNNPIIQSLYSTAFYIMNICQDRCLFGPKTAKQTFTRSVYFQNPDFFHLGNLLWQFEQGFPNLGINNLSQGAF